MVSKNRADFVQGSLFEEDYLIRTLGALATSPEIALTELVANAWDAGATKVQIEIPDDYGQTIIIEDNGTGLTKEQFHYRWMRLGYNRLKHQGRKVLFPPGVQGKRFAYGRNGIGRHGLLCFNSEYSVITSCDGQKSSFQVTTLSEDQPFVIKDESFSKSKKHGTRLEVIVRKNLPRPNIILDRISARFLHDPNFTLSINGRTVPLGELSGLVDSRKINIEEITLQVHFVDSQRASKSTLHQGIAFWQGGRLVGEASWILGNRAVIDGRTKYAKRYTVVVETEDLGEHILGDWTAFKRSDIMDAVFDKVEEYVNEMFTIIARENIEETKLQIKSDFAEDYAILSPLAKYEVNEAIESIATYYPAARQESISLAVDTIIKLEKTRTGKELLLKLSKFSENDIEGLNSLLEKWTVRDALVALDEIDSRLSIIEAITKLSTDNDVDELHVLHPLVTSARWLFGPEFESAEFASNSQIKTAVEKVFNKKIQKEVFNNHKKRPDIVVLQDSILSITGTEAFDSDSNLSTTNRILLIELKRGGFKLTREERNQAQGYVEDLVGCGVLIGNPFVDAFVLGKEFSEKVQPISSVSNGNNVEVGKIRICTFSQIVDTAKRRLFGLREKLSERYDDIPGIELYNRQSTQLRMEFSKQQ